MMAVSQECIDVVSLQNAIHLLGYYRTPEDKREGFDILKKMLEEKQEIIDVFESTQFA
jgi:hypothetical protein